MLELENHQWMLKLVGKNLIKKIGYLYRLKLSLYKLCINYNEEKNNSSSTVAKSGRHHLNQAIRVNITNNGAINIMCFLIQSTEKNTASLL